MKSSTIKLTFVLLFGLFLASPAYGQADCNLEKVAVKAPKKKKKKKKNTDAVAVIQKPKVIETDTSRICPTYTTANIDKELLSEKFAYMALRRMAGDYDGALQHWECVYENAPGYSVLVYSDGAEIFLERAKEAKEAGDDSAMEEYGQKALDLLDKGGSCFEVEEEFYGVTAYAYEVLWPNKNDEIYEYYTKYLEFKGDDADSHTLKRATQYALHMHHGLDRISKDEAMNVAMTCKNIAADNQDRDEYKGALEEIEYYIEYYKPEEVVASTETSSTGGQAQAQENSALVKADQDIKSALSSGNGGGAVAALDQYIAAGGGSNFDMAMFVGQSLMGKSDNINARNALRKAATLNPSSGEPDYLIGRMYLGAGADCGPGTGFDSQRVLWAAFDKFRSAQTKSLQPDSQGFITQQMATYKQYLPTAAQIAAKGLSVGQSYTVPCWINEVTTVQLP